MSYSYNLASSEFHLLCQSQTKLLTQVLGALWSAVYLSKESGQNREPKLLPVAIYPQTAREPYQKLRGIELPEIWQQVIAEPINQQKLLLPDNLTEASFGNKTQIAKNLANQPLILPLIYENTVMGLLLVARENPDWQETELQQVERVAETLAIACFMERQSQWYRQQLFLQQEANRWDKDRLDDLLHQLRNPITALKTFSKLLIKKLLPEDRNQAFAKSILRESDRLSELLQQFETEIAPTDSASVTLRTTSVRIPETENNERSNFLLPDSKKELELVELKSILEPLLLTAEAIASEKALELIVNLKEEIPQVKGNPQALREVLNNLIDNAIKYTPTGGMVKIEIQVKDNLVGVAIQDTGYGIPQKDKSEIFTRHYRGIQATGDIPGSGLGLAIAKTLIQQMQGEIELISPNNLAANQEFPGTTFIVWMPRFS
ncbi:MAG TPA: ATP-binding protein [Xenococcaceae cyanobacterium]